MNNDRKWFRTDLCEIILLLHSHYDDTTRLLAIGRADEDKNDNAYDGYEQWIMIRNDFAQICAKWFRYYNAPKLLTPLSCYHEEANHDDMDASDTDDDNDHDT